MWDAIVIGSGIGGVGPQPGPAGRFGRLLAWLSNGEPRFVETGNPYDIVHLGDDSFNVCAPEAVFRSDLRQRFPHERGDRLRAKRGEQWRHHGAALQCTQHRDVEIGVRLASTKSRAPLPTPSPRSTWAKRWIWRASSP